MEMDKFASEVIEGTKEAGIMLGRIVAGPLYYTAVGMKEGFEQLTGRIAPVESPQPRPVELRGMVGHTIMAQEADLRLDPIHR
jgi:hypothetical protein